MIRYEFLLMVLGAFLALGAYGDDKQDQGTRSAAMILGTALVLLGALLMESKP